MKKKRKAPSLQDMAVSAGPVIRGDMAKSLIEAAAALERMKADADIVAPCILKMGLFVTALGAPPAATDMDGLLRALAWVSKAGEELSPVLLKCGKAIQAVDSRPRRARGEALDN